MARVFQSGFENNNQAATDEITGSGGTFDTAQVRTGTYAYKIASGASSVAATPVGYTSSNLSQFWYRQYIRLSALPNVATIVCGQKAAATDLQVIINTTGTVSIGLGTTATVQATSSKTVTPGRWFMLEIWNGGSTSANQEVRIDGVTFVTTTIASAGLRFGAIVIATAGTTSFDVWFDDLAMNDNTGSFNNSWCGGGGVFNIVPSADGSTAIWTVTGTASHFDAVNDLPGTVDTTTFVSSTSKAGSNGDPEESWSFTNAPAAMLSSAYMKALLGGVRGGGTGTQTRIGRFDWKDGDSASSVAWTWNGVNIDWNLNGYKTVYPILTQEWGHNPIIPQNVGGTFDWGTTGTGKVAQSFIAADDVIYGVSLYLGKTGSPVDNITVTLRDVPDGTILATGTITGSTLSSTGILTKSQLSFAAPANVSIGATYYVQLERTTALNSTNYYNIGINTTNYYANGSATYNNSGVWSPSTTDDFIFGIQVRRNLVSWINNGFGGMEDNNTNSNQINVTAVWVSVDFDIPDRWFPTYRRPALNRLRF